MNRLVTAGFAAVVLLGALSTPDARASQDGAAVPPRQGGPGRPNRPADQLGPAQVADMLDAYAVVQAQETLQLGDDQFGQFVTRLRKLQQTRRQNLCARNQILMELRRMLNPPPAAAPQAATPPDDNAIRDRLKALRDHDERAAIEIRHAYDALDEVLNPRQQARFRLLEERLEGRKLDLLMKARQGARRGGTQ
jgi:hypothetical protein